MKIVFRLLVCVGLLGLSSLGFSEFQPEQIGNSATLPKHYPDHWVMVHDISFFHMFEGEVLVIDPLGTNLGTQYKGMMTASFIASFERSAKRNEHYVVETFYSRGARGGERTDVVTIYDPSTLQVVDEVIIPAKRITGMPKSVTTSLLADDRFLAIYNFTPGQSVTIVDLQNREVVEEISIAGCGFVFANGQSSFSSICANGSFRTTQLDDQGKAAGNTKTGVVFSANDDPIFEGPGLTANTAYFVTFAGQVLPINTSAEKIEIGKNWWLTSTQERNWRPGGMNVITVDAGGIGYVLMNPEGGEGTHKDGGGEVWVYDLEQKQRIQRIELANWGLSLGTSGSGDDRLLLVTNVDMGIDVYKLTSGEFVHTLNTGAATPFVLHGAN